MLIPIEPIENVWEVHATSLTEAASGLESHHCQVGRAFKADIDSSSSGSPVLRFLVPVIHTMSLVDGNLVLQHIKVVLQTRELAATIQHAARDNELTQLAARQRPIGDAYASHVPTIHAMAGQGQPWQKSYLFFTNENSSTELTGYFCLLQAFVRGAEPSSGEN